MSADRLREAAKVLRERAEAATPGPWQHGEDWAAISADSDSVVHAYYQRPCEACGNDIYDEASVAVSVMDAAYIATMHPGVGLALADWLDAEADERRWGRRRDFDDVGISDRIADLVLGGAS